MFLAALAFARFRRLPLSALIAGAAALVLLYLMIGGPGTGLLQFLPVISQAPLSRFAFLLPLLVGWLAAVMMDDAGLSTRQVVVTALVLVAAAGVMAASFWNPGIAGNLHLLREDVVVALLLVGAAAAALVVRIRAPRYHTAASWTIAALVFANLAWFGRTYNPAGKVEDLFPVETTVQALQEQAGGERVVALQRGPVLFGPNVLAKFGLAEPSGYSSLVAARYHDLLTAADPELDSKLAGRASNHLLFSYPPPRLLDMLGVGTMVASEEIFDPGPGRRVCPYRLYGCHGTHHGCLAIGGHLRRVAHRHQPHRSALCCAPRRRVGRRPRPACLARGRRRRPLCRDAPAGD